DSGGIFKCLATPLAQYVPTIVKDRAVKDRQAVTSVLTVFGGCRCLEVVNVETTALFPYNSDLVQMYEYCAPPFFIRTEE
ncbi:MAG: hypothetical protein ACTH04_13410, partial [Halomonadaceae bacterium]